MKSANADKDRLIGYLFIGGGCAFVVGLFFGFLALVSGSSLFYAFTVLLILAAMGLAGGGIYLGMSKTQIVNKRGPRPEEEGRIVARFAINEVGEMIFDNFDYDAEGGKYYVRVQFLDRRREELETARPVFDQCGEGMRGLLTMEGGWLAQFVPLLDTDETRAAYKDW